MKPVTSINSIVLWLSRLFGMLNLPIVFIAVIDLISTPLNPSYIPQTIEQWTGFLTATTVLSGAVAGLTVKSGYSPNRKMVHLLLATSGLMLTFNSLVGLIIIFFAGNN